MHVDFLLFMTCVLTGFFLALMAFTLELHNPWWRRSSLQLNFMQIVWTNAELWQLAKALPAVLRAIVFCSGAESDQSLEKGNLSDLQLPALFSLGFFGFLRWDDLRLLSVDSFYFADSHVAIFLEKWKNDQFHKGSWVLIAHCSTSPCPTKSGKGADQEGAWQGRTGPHMESITCIQEKLLQKQLLVCQTDSCRDMEVREVRRLRTIT